MLSALLFVFDTYPMSLQRSGSLDGKIRLYERRPPTAQQIQACQVKMSYKTLPWTAGFFPVLPEARGANVAAMFFTLLSAAFGAAELLSLGDDSTESAASVVPVAS